MRELNRRTALGAMGLAGALAMLPAPTSAGAVRDAVERLTEDTMSGLAVFVMPGPDPYSRLQGTPLTDPGGIEAGLPAFLTDALDRYLPFPDLVAGPVVRGLLAETRSEGPFAFVLESDATIPLSGVVSLLLNLQAVRVDPSALQGPFTSPFARLALAEKAKVFALIEGADSDLVALLDAALPEPLKRTASGLLKFLGGALLELAALGGYAEWAVFDPATKRLRAQPVGWRLSGYRPSVDGAPEFKGYYQGRRAATG